jgi:hypothetical protein
MAVVRLGFGQRWRCHCVRRWSLDLRSAHHPLHSWFIELASAVPIEHETPISGPPVGTWVLGFFARGDAKAQSPSPGLGESGQGLKGTGIILFSACTRCTQYFKRSTFPIVSESPCSGSWVWVFLLPWSLAPSGTNLAILSPWAPCGHSRNHTTNPPQLTSHQLIWGSTRWG